MGKYDEHFYVEEEIEKQLLDGEKIIWRSKPFKPAFVVNKNLKNCLVFIFSVSNFFCVMLPLILSEEMQNVIFFRTVLLLCGIIVLFVAVCMLPFLAASKEWKYTEYALTDRRLIISGRGNGYVYTIVPLEEVKMLTLRQDGLDKLFGVGDLLITVNSGNNQGVCQILDIKDREALYFLLDEKLNALEEEKEGENKMPEMLDGMKSFL